jgi:hypothetical protein
MFRWSLNLVLAIIDDVLCCKSNMNSEDLVIVSVVFDIARSNMIELVSSISVQADDMSMCSFMCYFFLVFFKYRQNHLASQRAVKTCSSSDVTRPSDLCRVRDRPLNSCVGFIEDELRREQVNLTKKLAEFESTDVNDERQRLERDLFRSNSGKIHCSTCDVSVERENNETITFNAPRHMKSREHLLIGSHDSPLR